MSQVRMARMLPHPIKRSRLLTEPASFASGPTQFDLPDRQDFMNALRASPFICLLEASALQSFMRCCWAVALLSGFAPPDRCCLPASALQDFIRSCWVVSAHAPVASSAPATNPISIMLFIATLSLVEWKPQSSPAPCFFSLSTCKNSCAVVKSQKLGFKNRTGLALPQGITG